MADKGKGKVVNQWVSYVIDDTGESTSAKLPISLTIKDGLFHIPLPQHITDFLGPNPTFPEHLGADRDRFYLHHEQEVVAKTIDGVKARHDQVMKFYQATLRDAGRRKVIVVEFNGDSSDRDYYPRMNARGLSRMVRTAHMRQGKAPALSLNFEVMWEMGGKLYRVHERADGPPQMTYMRMAPSAVKGNSHSLDAIFMLDWTVEREAFFRQMEEAMNKLIERIAIMLGGDLQETVDRMITSGGGLLSLPAPDA